MAEYQLRVDRRVTLWHWNGKDWDYVRKIWQIDDTGLLIGERQHIGNLYHAVKTKLTDIEISNHTSVIIVTEVD